MKIKLVAAGVLAGGIAVTGLTGSAYAAGGTSTAKATAPGKAAHTVKVAGTAAGAAKGHDMVAVACAGKGVRIKGKPDKGVFSTKAPGKLPAPPEMSGRHFKVGRDAKALPGVKMTRLVAAKGKARIVKIGPMPKGLHCFQVKPGTPGAPPRVPAR